MAAMFAINILVAICFLLAFLSYSGDIVSRGVFKPYRALHKLAMVDLPLAVKFKVRGVTPEECLQKKEKNMKKLTL